MADEDLALDQAEEIEGAADDEGEGSPEDQFMARLKEAVEVEKEDLGGLRLKLKITVPREVLDERLHDQFSELRREALVPGFRKGHAPLKLVEKRFAADVSEELKGKMVGSGFMAAVEKLEVKPLGDPLIWIKTKEDRVGEDQKSRTVEVEKLMGFEKALEHISLPKEGSLSFTCEMEIRPEFELPELDKIPLEKPAVSVEDDDVETEITKILQWSGTFAPVESGPVKEDDLLYTSMKLTVDGELLDSQENFDVPARDGRIRNIPTVGLKDKLVGKKLGDTVTLDAAVPDDHEDLNLRGKTATFEFSIQEIKRLTQRLIDKEFLEELGFESEEALRLAVRERMEREINHVIDRRLKEQVGEYLIENTKFEIPAGLSNRQTERAVARRMIELYQQGTPESEIEKNLDQFRSTAHGQVVRDFKLYFILDRIAQEREVEVTDEEMNGAVAQIAQRTGKRFDRVRDELAKGDGMATLYMRIRDDRILGQLIETASIKEVEGPKKTKSTKKASDAVVGASDKPKAAAPAAKKKAPARSSAPAKPAAKGKTKK